MRRGARGQIWLARVWEKSEMDFQDRLKGSDGQTREDCPRGYCGKSRGREDTVYPGPWQWS